MGTCEVNGVANAETQAHMRTLQEYGYISVTKEFKQGRPLTSYSLTKEGRKAFTAYIDLLEQIVQQTRKKGN